MQTSLQILLTVHTTANNQGEILNWFFDGLGTLIIGLVIGGAGGSGVTWSVMRKKSTQNQKARDNVQQIQAGRNMKIQK
jgi:hypothetical protein